MVGCEIMDAAERIMAFRQYLYGLLLDDSGGYLSPTVINQIILHVMQIAQHASRDCQRRLIENSEQLNIGLNVKFPVLTSEREFSLDKSCRAANN
jgi:hypothetical protein